MGREIQISKSFSFLSKELFIEQDLKKISKILEATDSQTIIFFGLKNFNFHDLWINNFE